MYKDGHLNKRMLSQKFGLLKTFIAFVAFGKVGEAVEKKEEPLLVSDSLDLTSVEMSIEPRQSVCEILDDAKLGKYKSKFASVGLQSFVDLVEADDEDLEEAGLSRFEKKKLRRALKEKGGSE